MERKTDLRRRPSRHGRLARWSRRLAREQAASCSRRGTPSSICATRPRSAPGWTRQRPDGVFVAAAKVGGILANDTRAADFLYDNLMIAANVIEAAHWTGVEKLLFLGSSCIYPRWRRSRSPRTAC